MNVNKFHTWANRFRWLHEAIAVLGGVAFLAGSILFFWKSTHTAALILFVIGSAGFLIGNLGSFLISLGKHQINN